MAHVQTQNYNRSWQYNINPQPPKLSTLKTCIFSLSLLSIILTSKDYI